MIGHTTSGDEVTWVSHKPRTRRVRVVTPLKAVEGVCLVRILGGLPGEVGQYRVVPTARLSAG